LSASTPGAIGYSGMAFATPEVKVLRVSMGPGETAQAPTLGAVLSKRYPISRSLLVYTMGEPREPVRRYIEWIQSAEGQRIVAEVGYVPIDCQKNVEGECVETGSK
jgi:phosphate transport system substrate-binding protein